MAADISDPAFHDDTKAREHLEAVRWPDGPFCPHCGSFNAVRMAGNAHRTGLLNCRDCREQFSVTVGTVFERSHIPLAKWLMANHLMNASKKGISAHQLHRMLDISYKSAWFMCHRIREAMRDPHPVPLGGTGKIVEADEAYHGKRETPRIRNKYSPPPTKRGKGGGADKRPIVALVERGGEARAKHMNHVTGKNLRDFIVRNASLSTPERKGAAWWSEFLE